MRSRTFRVVVVAVVLLLVVTSPLVTVASAQDEDNEEVTVDNKCTGGWFDKKTCEMMNSGVGWVLTMIYDAITAIITWVLDTITGTPVPTHNGGEPAFIQRPDNQPWQTVYDSWLSLAVPIGLTEWALMILGVQFSNVFMSGSQAEVKRRELHHRTWKVLLGVLGSWAIGATILHLANGITHTVAPTGEDVAGNLAVFAANLQGVSLSAILIWFFSGTIFLFILLLLLVRLAVIFTIMWGLPVLLPLAALNIGPVAPLSKPARGIIDMFIPFVFMTLPIAMVLKVGYLVMNGLNQSALVAAVFSQTGLNSVILVGFWTVAALSPLFVFHQAGRIAGYAALLGASSVSDDVQEKAQEAKENVDRRMPPRYDKGPEIHDPYAGAPSGGGFGGAVGSGSGTDQPSMLGAGTNSRNTHDDFWSPDHHALGTADNGSSLGTVNDGSELGAANTGSPLDSGEYGPKAPTDASALNEGDGGVGTRGANAGAGTSAETDGATNQITSTEDVIQVDHPRDLPTGDYQVGHIRDDGEFQPIRKNEGLSRTALLNGNYDRLNTRTHKYQDEKLLVQSQDSGAYYDLDSMSYREQSYEEMSRETSEDVLNS